MKYAKTVDPACTDLSVCQDCGLCIARCPMDIPIPDMLLIYQRYRSEGESALSTLNTRDFPAYPIDCIEWGACSAVCPKQFDLAHTIREMAIESCI